MFCSTACQFLGSSAGVFSKGYGCINTITRFIRYHLKRKKLKKKKEVLLLICYLELCIISNFIKTPNATSFSREFKVWMHDVQRFVFYGFMCFFCEVWTDLA